ncbi:MAG: trypsin-like peptidase domain-containing protein [Desulfurococcales archaeon]|nr:trypsin-like peptidase domain-containing protein [Desulfurococcales archaeon]
MSSTHYNFNKKTITLSVLFFLIILIISIVPVQVFSQEKLDPQTELSIRLQEARSAVVLIITVVSGYIIWEEFLPYTSSVGLEMPVEVQSTAFGSGFLVSPNGYLITNGHVVNDFDSELQEVLPLLINFASMYSDAYYKVTGIPLTQEEYDSLVNSIISAYLTNRLKIQDYKVTVYVGMGKVVSGLGNLPKFTPARIIESRPFEKEDLALLKIEVSHAPSLVVSKDDIAKVGDRVWAIGYPGAVAFHEILSTETLMEPTITEGTVSGYRSKVTGVRVLQSDVDVTHGNSGGPVVNSEGVVVAVTSFGSVDPTGSGREVPGFNFFVPSSLVWEMMARNNVDNTQDVVMQYFEEGLRLYYTRHYSAALEKFRAVKELFPGFPYVDDYIADSQAAIARGEDVPLRSFDATLLIGVIAVIAAGAGATGFMLYRRRRVRQQVMTAPGQDYPVIQQVEQGEQEAINVPQATPTPGPVTPTVETAEGDYKFCWNCGRRIPGDAKLCPYCGANQEL